jgi:hypothetical protein
VKRDALLKRIGQEAKRQEIEWEIDREGANHTVYRLGRTTKIPVPRHTEIDERLAEEIFKECAADLGRRWWRR